MTWIIIILIAGFSIVIERLTEIAKTLKENLHAIRHDLEKIVENR